MYYFLSDDETWKRVLEYFGVNQYLESVGELNKINPTYVADYLLYPGNPKTTYTVMANSGIFNDVTIVPKENDRFDVFIVDMVHGENFGLFDDDDVRWSLLNYFIIPDENGGEEYRVLHKHLENVERVLLGIVQDEKMHSWGNQFTRDSFHANTILVHVDGQEYNYIQGGVISKFMIPEGETIHTYYSYLGNNTVAFPIALSENYAYFMTEKIMIPLRFFPPATDIDYWKNDAILSIYRDDMIAGVVKQQRIHLEMKEIY
tara:strand:- start:750 stop:1529 length:780 start_codon:yes stop_codon:yes gene_type:complete